METVTASDIVRHFGAWQDRALVAPVYICRHGRARHVLASVEFLQQAMARRDDRGGDDSAAQFLLDMSDAMVVVVDASSSVVAMSAAARRRFAVADGRGRSLADILPPAIGPIVLRAVDDVRARATPERLQLRLESGTGCRLDVAVHPYGDGVAIIVHDRGDVEARIETDAMIAATRETLSLLGDAAILRISLRGHIVDATPSFAAMSGLEPAAYASVRAATLFDIGTRIAVGEAIDRAIERQAPQLLDARLLVNRGQAVDVRVALSPEPLRRSIDAIVATIVRRPTAPAIGD